MPCFKAKISTDFQIWTAKGFHIFKKYPLWLLVVYFFYIFLEFIAFILKIFVYNLSYLLTILPSKSLFWNSFFFFFISLIFFIVHVFLDMESQTTIFYFGFIYVLLVLLFIHLCFPYKIFFRFDRTSLFWNASLKPFSLFRCFSFPSIDSAYICSVLSFIFKKNSLSFFLYLSSVFSFLLSLFLRFYSILFSFSWWFHSVASLYSAYFLHSFFLLTIVILIFYISYLSFIPIILFISALSFLLCLFLSYLVYIYFYKLYR